MVSVEIATNLNDVVQFLGSFRQSVVSTHDLAEFPSVKALVTSEETSSLTRGADERCSVNGTDHMDDEIVATGSVGRHTLDDAFSHVVLIPVLGFSQTSSLRCSWLMHPTPSPTAERRRP